MYPPYSMLRYIEPVRYFYIQRKPAITFNVTIITSSIVDYAAKHCRYFHMLAQLRPCCSLFTDVLKVVAQVVNIHSVSDFGSQRPS